MRKAAISALVLAVVTQFVVFGAAPQALAVTSCSESGCDGLLAANTTCANDAEVIYEVNVYNPDDVVQIVGNIELKYSPSCRTVWGRAISNLGYGGDAAVENTQNTNNFESCQITGAAGTGCNTPMLNDAGVTSRAAADIYTANGTLCQAETSAY